jgi:hypothetical protein
MPDEIADHVGIIANAPLQAAQAIRAELTGSDRCHALGISVRSAAPVLSLCRALVEVGHDLAIPLEAWRDDVCCIRVRSIGEGARLTVEDDRHGRPRFRRWRERERVARPRQSRQPMEGPPDRPDDQTQQVIEGHERAQE